MIFIIGLPLLVVGNDNSYDIILVIIDRLIKIMYYKPIKTIIDRASLAAVIIDIIVRYYSLPESIIVTGALFLLQGSGFYYTIFLISSKSFSLYFIYK